jgi:hypothetical protein
MLSRANIWGRETTPDLQSTEYGDIRSTKTVIAGQVVGIQSLIINRYGEHQETHLSTPTTMNWLILQESSLLTVHIAQEKMKRQKRAHKAEMKSFNTCTSELEERLNGVERAE